MYSPAEPNRMCFVGRMGWGLEERVEKGISPPERKNAKKLQKNAVNKVRCQ